MPLPFLLQERKMKIKRHIEVRHDYDDCGDEECYIIAKTGEDDSDHIDLEMSIPYIDGSPIGSWTSLSQDQAQDLINALQAYLDEVNKPTPMIVNMPVQPGPYEKIWTTYTPEINPYMNVTCNFGFSDGPATGDTE